MVVPLLEELLGWSEFETSLFFCGAGVEVSTISSLHYNKLLFPLYNKAHRFICSIIICEQEDI